MIYSYVLIIRKFRIILVSLASLTSLRAASAPLNFPDALIVPGKRLGGLAIGNGHDAPGIPDPDSSDSAMGGKSGSFWLLGEHRGDLGRPFHRPDEIVAFSLRDMEHDSAAHAGKVTRTAVFTTSPRFATADHIHCGSTLEDIHHHYPGAAADSNTQYWPLFGTVRSYLDKKAGICFVVQESTGLCIKIGVIVSGPYTFYSNNAPFAATSDYSIGHTEGTDDGNQDIASDSVGGIFPGMPRARVLSLLGPPLKKTTEYDGDWLYWRAPPQEKTGPPAFSVHIGHDVVTQIRVTSPAFLAESSSHVGCSLQVARDSVGGVQKLDIWPATTHPFYGSIQRGILFEFDPAGKTCTAISVFSPPVFD